jgi:hypothetical protein
MGRTEVEFEGEYKKEASGLNLLFAFSPSNSTSFFEVGWGWDVRNVVKAVLIVKFFVRQSATGRSLIRVTHRKFEQS